MGKLIQGELVYVIRNKRQHPENLLLVSDESKIGTLLYYEEIDEEDFWAMPRKYQSAEVELLNGKIISIYKEDTYTGKYIIISLTQLKKYLFEKVKEIDKLSSAVE